MTAIEIEQDSTSTELSDLIQLVDHQEAVQTTETVEHVYDWFQKHRQEYIGVLRDKQFVGLVSRGQVGFLLGARYGYAIYGRQPIGSHLMDKPLQLTSTTPLLSALESALSRTGDRFYDDVVLLSEAEEFLGIITVPTLVRWQSRLILEKTRLAENQQQSLQEKNRDLFRSLNELRQSRGRFEILFENSALGVALLNPRGEMETCNRRLATLLEIELDPAGLQTHNLNGYLTSKEQESFLRLLQDHENNSNNTSARTSEFMLQLPGRGPRLFKFFSNWVRETGQVCLLLDDITEQRVLEHRLIQKEKSALLDSLVGGIAHEINNKLVPIIGYSDILLTQIASLKEVETHVPDCGSQANCKARDNLKEFEKFGAYFRTIRDAALESAKIIRQVLQLSRPLAREMAVVNLCDLFNEVQALLRFRLRESGCQVTTQFPAEPALVQVDASQIKQVLINLIFNALDAMENVPQKQLRLSIKASAGDVVFRVADNGHGIAPENLGRIFNPFFTTKAVDRGSGLGLSVCQNILKNNHGDIAVESTPGAGAVFKVTLPQATPEQIRAAAAAKQSASPGATSEPVQPEERIRILVVDDEEFITAMVQEALRRSISCLVERAESGQHAVARLQQADFDLVISDVRMPGMDGFQLFDWILKHQPRLAEHFLFITGDAGSSNLTEKLESMSVPVLRKPFEIDTLLHHCRKLLKH